MKTTKMLTIVVLALGLIVWQAEVSEAAPMGTAFTYQGRLIDANDAADGLYDFEFKLFDDPCTGTQQGSTIDVNDLDVIDGYFTAELDFGSDVFNGDARWLETTVSHADGSDPCTLSPRQEVTPTPYALHTRWFLVDAALGNVFAGEGAGASTTGYYNTAMGNNALYSNTTGWGNSAMGYDALYYNTTGNQNSAVGYAALYYNTTGYRNSAVGYEALRSNTTGYYNSAMGYNALYSNTTGNQNSAVGYQANLFNQEGSRNTIIGYHAGRGTSAHNKSGNVFVGYQAGYYETGDNKLYIANSHVNPPLIYGDFSTGRVGIGTTNPDAKLEVNGQVKITGGSPGADKVLTSDASGLASWQTPAGGGDNLGNHIATQNIRLNGHWLSGDGGNEGVFVNNAGNVGIGTTNPTAPLHISTSGNYIANAGTTGASDLIFNVVPGSNKYFVLNNNGIGGGIALSIGNNKKLVVANDGKVGIGTTSPSEKLEVVGNVKVSGTGNGVIFPDGTKQTTASAGGGEVYFSVKRDGTYNWATNGVYLLVDFSSSSSVLDNAGGGFNAATSTFTAPDSGTYTFHGTIDFRSINAGNLIYASIKAAGHNYYSNKNYASGTIQMVSCSITVHLDAGETAQLWGYVNDSVPPAQVYGNSSTTYSFTNFMGARVF